MKTYLLAPKCSLPIKNKAEKQARAVRKLQIEKKKEHLLEKRVKNVEAELISFRASQKDVHKTYSEDVQIFFQKACWWRVERIENNLLQQIEEDIKLNEELYTQQMTKSNGMDRI